MRETTVFEIKARVDCFKYRLSGLCRGLAETTDRHQVGKWDSNSPGHFAFKKKQLYSGIVLSTNFFSKKPQKT
jgi:hypothetical protein